MINRFLRNRDGSVAMTFALAVVPMFTLVGLVINYEKLLADQAHLQTGADSAALAIENQVTQYYYQNGAWPSASTITSTYLTTATNAVSAATGGAGSVATGDLHVCTAATCSFVLNNGQSITLTTGQVAVRASLSQAPLISFGTSSSSNTVSATSVVSSSATFKSAATVNFQFQYAKGWYYKVVTLYVVPTGATTPFVLATWTYQPTNQHTVATPSTSFTDFVASATNSNTTDTGVGTVTASYASGTTTVTDSTGNLVSVTTGKAATGYASSGATMTTDSTTGNTTISLGAYSSLYLTMQVQNQSCAPGMTTKVSTNSSTLGAVTCSGTANSTFSTIMSTNSLTNSNYIWINAVEQPANAAIPQMAAFPCSSSTTAGATQTTYYEWEDSNATSGDRDFFFSLTTTCSAGHWTMTPPKLLN